MPIYEYEHAGRSCKLGKRFEVMQSISDPPLARCPHCNARIDKLISFTYVSTPKTSAELRDMGFTKLVRRDDGVYENVTARGGDSQMVLRDRPETLPNIKRTVRD